MSFLISLKVLKVARRYLGCVSEGESSKHELQFKGLLGLMHVVCEE